MEALRVEIRAITASFRYPMFVVSYQPTYKIPPISTIYGLLSAAKGKKVSIYDVSVGYDFTSEGSGVDLEPEQIKHSPLQATLNSLTVRFRDG